MISIDYEVFEHRSQEDLSDPCDEYLSSQAPSANDIISSSSVKVPFLMQDAGVMCNESLQFQAKHARSWLCP